MSLNDYYLYNKEKNIRNYNITSPLIMFTIGKGRAEYISDAVTVLRLFDELKSKHLLIKEPTNENIIDFSNIIIRFNNTRVLDDRINRIAMLEAMIIYLKEYKLVEEYNASTFAILNDQVYFSITAVRFCGKVSQFKAGTGYSNMAINLKTDSSRTGNLNHDISPQIIYNFTRYSPMDLKNQLNSGIEFDLEYTIVNYRSIYEQDTFMVRSTTKKQILSPTVSAFIERGYYPTTRTALTWNNSLTFYTGKIIGNTNYDMNMDIRFISKLSFYYYISPQLRLSIEDKLSSANSMDFSSNQFPQSNSSVSNSLNALLTYAIF